MLYSTLFDTKIVPRDAILRKIQTALKLALSSLNVKPLMFLDVIRSSKTGLKLQRIKEDNVHELSNQITRFYLLEINVHNKITRLYPSETSIYGVERELSP